MVSLPPAGERDSVNEANVQTLNKECLMFARNVTLHLKAHKADEFTRTLETDVLPLLRRQPGFKDEITFIASDDDKAVAISLWDKRENAETYSRETYPAVLQKLQAVVDGTPEVESFDVPLSTIHKISAQPSQSFALILWRSET